MLNKLVKKCVFYFTIPWVVGRKDIDSKEEEEEVEVSKTKTKYVV